MNDRIEGALLGTAVGDALGLHREGLTARRAAKLYGVAPLSHRFFLKRGMMSDDTEHSCMVGQSLLAAPDDAAAFARSFAWRLRGWFVCLPVAMGWGTLRAVVKLWLGFSPETSGVFSAGNGPAMRAPIIGVCAPDLAWLKAYVHASTRLTHSDPKAEQGALAIALAAYYGSRGVIDPQAIIAKLQEQLTDKELLAMLETISRSLTQSCSEFAKSMGCDGFVSGYMYHTVPAALFCWLHYLASPREAIEAAILLGGDADTVGAIVGGLVGATHGAARLPIEWVSGLFEWPRSVSWMRRLAARLTLQFPREGGAIRSKPLRLFWPGLLLRNLFFLAGVLRYGFRRLLPPY